MSITASPVHSDALRSRSENKIVVVQIDNRLDGQLASAPDNNSAGQVKNFDKSIVGVSVLNNYLFTQERPGFDYVFVEPPAGGDRNPYRDVDGFRRLSHYWGKVYALAMCMRAMPQARWFLVLDTDAFLGVTAAGHKLEKYIHMAERSNRHVVLQACRTEDVSESPDFWGRELGKITPPVYAEPMAFNSGALLVRQSPEGRAFINTWLGLTAEAMGPSPLEQRYTTMEVSVQLDGLETGTASDELAHDIVASAIGKARARGAPIQQQHEQACIAKAPKVFRDIEPSKTHPSATMTDQQLNFNLRSVSGNAPLRELAQWICRGDCKGEFAQILQDILVERQTEKPPVVTAISARIVQDCTGKFLIDWPGDQERLSWAYGLLSRHVLVVPWNNDPRMRSFQYVLGNLHPLLPTDTVLVWCAAPIWHVCHDDKTELAAHQWVSSVLTSRYTDNELDLRQVPVLRPDWGDTKTGGESCTLEALLARIDAGKFDLWLPPKGSMTPGRRRQLRLRRAVEFIRARHPVSRLVGRLKRLRRRLLG